jgi:hypothetical protein
MPGRRLSTTLAGLFAVLVTPAAFAASSATATPTTAPRNVTAVIQLPARTARAGRPVHGSLVLRNTGRRTLDLRQGCTPQWQVVLGRGRSAPPVAFSMICGTAPFRVPPGTTKRPFTLSTRADGCAADAAQVTADLPQCGADGRPPPLAPGRYRAFLVSSGGDFPTADPVKLRLTRR